MWFLDQAMNSLVWFYEFIVSNITVDSVIKFVILYFFVIWVAFVIWIVKDITNRTTNIFLQISSILIVIVFTPIFWLPIYLLIRPRSTIFEKYYEEEEFEEWQEEQEEVVVEECTCPKCWKDVNSDFQFCPYCEFKLVSGCSNCNKPIRSEWKICPYCWTEQENKKPKQVQKVEVEKVSNPKKPKKIDLLAKIEQE